MSSITILENELFDDGSIECFNFIIADQDGAYSASLKFIESLFLNGDFRDRFALNRAKGYLDVSKECLVYGGVQILEIQWG